MNSLLCLIAVFRCQSDIQMLARPRANPSVRTQHHPHDAGVSACNASMRAVCQLSRC